MTYYKNDKCKALNSANHDCICWTPEAQQEPVQTTAVYITWNSEGVRTVNGVPDYTPPAQPAPEQEPVAWQYVVQLLIAAGHVSKQKVDQACEIAKAQPKPTGKAPCIRHCEANAFKITIRQLNGDIERMKAAQRTWVGLTLTEIDEFEKGSLNRQALCCAIEAKLKEKNT